MGTGTTLIRGWRDDPWHACLVDLTSPILEATRERLLARFGEIAGAWWHGVPEMLSSLSADWAITIGEPVGRGNTSLVMRCRLGDGRSAILKVTPEETIARGEATALRSWSPSGRVPEVWGHDPTRGALLLEAISNETPLAEQTIVVDLDEIAGLIGALHVSGDPVIGDGVVSLADRVDFMFDHWRTRQGPSSPVPRDRVDRGYELARELADQPDSLALLHGDLHAYNVLDGGETRGLVAIDPRPCVGDAAFDAVDWVIWPKDEPQNWEPRCNQLGEAMGVGAERIWDWVRAFAAMLAGKTLTRGDRPDRAEAFLAIAP